MEKGRNLYGLDLLKVLAATLIVVHHYQQVFNLHFNGVNFYDGAFNVGYFVEFFFITSGFLTLYTDKSGGAKELKHKLLRIFPMASIACLFTLIVKSIYADNLSTLWNFKSLLVNFLLIFSGYPYFSMIGINNPTWYLCILIQCYLMYYIIRILSEKIGIRRIWFDITIIVLTVGLHHFSLLPESTYRGLEAFSIGVVLCGLREKIPKKKWFALILIILSIAAIVIIPAQQRRICTFIAFPAIVLLCVWSRFEINDTTRNIISTSGKVSFELYIWHYPLMAVEQMIMRISGFEIERSYLSMTAFVIVAWILAYLLFRYVEKPINQLIREKTQ